MSKHDQMDKIIRRVWKQRIQSSRQQPWLASMRMRYGEPLLTRFQHHYQALRNLPRRTRRLLKRRLAMSLAAAALLLALSGAPVHLTVSASTVSGDTQIVQVRRGSRGSDFGRFSERPQEGVFQTAAGNTVTNSTAIQPKGRAATIVVDGNNPATGNFRTVVTRQLSAMSSPCFRPNSPVSQGAKSYQPDHSNLRNKPAIHRLTINKINACFPLTNFKLLQSAPPLPVAAGL